MLIKWSVKCGKYEPCKRQSGGEGWFLYFYVSMGKQAFILENNPFSGIVQEVEGQGQGQHAFRCQQKTIRSISLNH